MKCSKCGHIMTVHISQSSLQGYWNMDYCERCGEYTAVDHHDACACGTSFSRFLDTGLLGCESCYDFYSEKLNSLLVQYRGRATVEGTNLFSGLHSSLSRMRTEEIRDILKSHASQHKNSAAASLRGPACAHGVSSNEKIYIESMRVRMARNMSGLPYLNMLSLDQKQALSSVLFSAAGILNQWISRRDDSMDRRMYSGDEDHFRMQWIVMDSDLNTDTVLSYLETILAEAEELEQFYTWQFHDKYGYLTACPGNSGTGLRVSFRLHIQGLKSAGRWNLWRRNLKDSGFTIRGHKGENSKETDVIEISTMKTWNLNIKEELLMNSAMIERLVKSEMEYRKSS